MNGTGCGCGRFFAGMAAGLAAGTAIGMTMAPPAGKRPPTGRPSVSDAVETLTDAMGM